MAAEEKAGDLDICNSGAVFAAAALAITPLNVILMTGHFWEGVG